MSDLQERLLRAAHHRASHHEALHGEASDEIERLLSELEAYREIARNSNGVAGWHLNGDIATWEELGIER